MAAIQGTRVAAIKRTLSSLVSVLAAYMAYSWVVVPIVEPGVERRPNASSGSADPAGRATDLYRAELAPLFPAGAWELEHPKVLRSERGATVLWKTFDTLPDGDAATEEPAGARTFALRPCTIILYPSGRRRTSQSPDALIMQAPEGAVLTFDEPLNLQRAEFGRPVGGRLIGPIRIYGVGQQSSLAGLEIKTSNIEITNRRIWTRERVEFHLGQHSGSGSYLVLTLNDGPARPTTDQARQLMAGLKSVELERLEKLHLQLENTDMFSPQTTNGQPDQAGNPVPVEVTCNGPVRMNLLERIATLEDTVELSCRPNPDGPLDRLNCQRLSLHFAEDQPTFSPQPTAASPAATGPSAARDVSIERVVASGSPVAVRAPSRGVFLQGQRLEYNFKTRRLHLRGANPIGSPGNESGEAIFQDPNHLVQAGELEYVSGANDQLGSFRAAGPGRYQGSPGPGTPPVQASWKHELELRPQPDQHVLRIVGRARVASPDLGGIWAGEIEVRFPRLSLPSARRDADSSSRPSRLPQPQRVLAVAGEDGFVHFDSAQLSGSVRSLDTLIRSLPDEPANPRPEDQATGQGLVVAAPSRLGSNAAAGQKYHLRGGDVAVWLNRRGRATELSRAQVIGQTRLVATQLAAPDQSPLQISGHSLRIDDVSQEAGGQVVVEGGPAAVMARGLELYGDRIQLDRGANRLWIDGPGTMKVPLPRDFSGNQLAPGQQLTVMWEGGMNFDGQTVVYSRNVLAKSTREVLRSETLRVQISQPINFSRPPNGADHIDVLTLTAGEDVYLDSETVDPNQGRTSIIRMYVRNLRVDQRGGEVLADGPGWVTSVSVGDDESFSLQQMVASSQPAGSASGPKTSPLVYLNVKFRDRLIGNLYDREVRLLERVQAVYGPVSSWSDQVDPDATDGLGPQDVRLYANELKVAQFGQMVGNQRPMELTALGDAVVEGKAFDARCHQIKYVQAKDLLILEGDARQAAELRRWNETGGPVARSVARYFYLWPRRREFRMDDGQFGEFLGPAGAMSN